MEQSLAPQLSAGDIVIAGNLVYHTVVGVRAAIQARGAALLFLPVCSSDFNLIAHIPAAQGQTRTCDALWRRVGPFTSTECTNVLAN